MMLRIRFALALSFQSRFKVNESLYVAFCVKRTSLHLKQCIFQTRNSLNLI